LTGLANHGPCGVGIRTIGKYVPELTVANAELEQQLDTTAAWIDKYLGISTRRRSATDEWTSDLGAAALADACERIAGGLDSIDLVVCGTFTPDHMVPATAVAIMRKLGVTGVPGFDVNSGGCPGGTFALDVGAKYLLSGAYDRVAVVVADVTSKTLDPEDRTCQAIFGDAAACYLLEPSVSGTGVASALLRSDPTGYEVAIARRGERTWPDGSPKRSPFGANFIEMDGRAVWEFAVRHVPDFFRELLKVNGYTIDDVDLVILHQASYRLLQRLATEIGLPESRIATNVERIGNTSGAGIALALREALDQHRVKAGDLVMLVSFGAGMSLGGTVIRWPADTEFLH
jgi:3-oxoacyl-[acyl-carrier-protein] synthase-3